MGLSNFRGTLQGDGSEALLGLAKDTYLDKVISDYPVEELPAQLDEDKRKLKDVFVRLQDARALIEMGLAYSDEHRYIDALVCYEKSLAFPNHKPDAFIWHYKGYANAKLERYKDALGDYDIAISLNRSIAATWYNKGTTEMELENYEGALDSFNQSTGLDPNDPAGWNNMGNAFAYLRKYQEALSAYEKALKLDDTIAAIWNNIGRARENLGQPKEAQIAFERARQIDLRTLATGVQIEHLD